jgi:signal transduction histidine kinase
MAAMESLSDDSVLPRPRPGRGSLRTWAWALVLAVAGLLLLSLLAMLALMRVWGGEVGLVHTALMLTAFVTGLMVLIAAAVGWHVGVRLTRQRLHEPLREVRQLLHLQAQLQPAWQWASDVEHRLVRWQAPQGAPASSWAGAGLSTQHVWDRFEASGGAPLLRQHLDAQRPFGELELREGTTQWRLRGLPLFDAQGRFAGYVGTATNPVAAVEAAPAADAGLLAEYESFAYSVSHDLRAPLRVVEGFARILKEDYGRLLDRIGNDHLDRIQGAAARMNGMIEALLSLSQLTTRPLARQPVQLSQLAGFILEELQRQSPTRGLKAEIEPGLTVQGDPTLLRLLLENLLGNAWKYSAKQACAEIRFGTVQIEGRRVFVVSDNGAGFDMRFADRLFGVFQRLHSASDFPGTGVGLALTRRIVRRHGGEIWAESTVGEGARFYFTLA